MVGVEDIDIVAGFRAGVAGTSIVTAIGAVDSGGVIGTRIAGVTIRPAIVIADMSTTANKNASKHRLEAFL